jgi:biopolymer transport protein ExbD
MGMMVGGKRGTVSEMIVVPLIDILLVLLVIFMIIPVHSKGLDALVPRQATSKDQVIRPEEVVVVQVRADGTLRSNQEPLAWEALGGRLQEVFKMRASRTAFIRCDGPVEFGVVAKVIDVMHTSGIASVGLLTPDLDTGL